MLVQNSVTIFFQFRRQSCRKDFTSFIDEEVCFWLIMEVLASFFSPININKIFKLIINLNQINDLDAYPYQNWCLLRRQTLYKAEVQEHSHPDLQPQPGYYSTLPVLFKATSLLILKNRIIIIKRAGYIVLSYLHIYSGAIE